MASLIYSKRAFRDIERLVDFVMERGSDEAGTVVELIADAIAILERHPLIGRPVEELRELVISRGKTGYVALYDYDAAADEVVILALRAQREAGYE